MEALRTHVAGVDVHKAKLAITVLRGPADAKPEEYQFECETFTEDLIKGGQKLLDMGIREVAMESTGIYWKPIHNVWSPMGINLTVAQAAHVKNVPGRKTDMNDSQWLASLHRHGLIRASLIPADSFQSIRMLTRHRKNLVGDFARVKNRIQKILEDGNVKWGTIVSDVFGKSGLKILALIAKGIIDAPTLALEVTTNIRRKKDVHKALTNCLTKIHVFTIKELMSQYNDLEKRIADTDKRLVELVAPYRHLVDALKKIPGIDEVLAMGILAESTDDMGHFANERHYAAWAGVAAGNNESAGKKKDQNVGRAIHI